MPGPIIYGSGSIGAKFRSSQIYFSQYFVIGGSIDALSTALCYCVMGNRTYLGKN